MKVNMKNGTRGTKRICDTCSYASIAKGSAESQEVVYCSTFSRQMPFTVVECNSHHDINKVPLSSLYQMAWIITNEKEKGKMGFQPYNEWVKGDKMRKFEHLEHEE